MTGDLFTLPPDADVRVSPLYKKKLGSRVSNEYKNKILDLDAAADEILANPTPEPAPTPVAPPKKRGVIEDTVRAIPGGMINASREMAFTLHDLKNSLSSWMYDVTGGTHDLGYTPTNKTAREDIKKDIGYEAQTIPGKLVEGISQFATGFFTGGRILKPIAARYVPPGFELTGKAAAAAVTAKGMAKGAFADFTSFDPHMERLSNLVETAKPLGIDLSNPITRYLASKPDDTEAEGRFKNTLEGLGIGAAVEGLFYGVKLLKARNSSPKEAVDAFDEALSSAKTTADEVSASPSAPFTDLTNPEAIRKAKQFDVAERLRQEESLGRKIDEAEKAALEEERRLRERDEGILDSESFHEEVKPLTESFDPTETIPRSQSLAEILDSEVITKLQAKGNIHLGEDLTYLRNVDYPRPPEFSKPSTVDELILRDTGVHGKPVPYGSLDEATHPLKPGEDVMFARRVRGIPKGAVGEDLAASERLATAAASGSTVINYARNLGHDSLDSFLSSLRNNLGFTKQALMHDIAGGGTGAVIGGATDITGDGQVTWKDVAAGFVMGMGLVHGGKAIVTKLTEGKTKAQAVKELTTEKAAELDAVISKLRSALGTGTLDEKTIAKINSQLEVLEKFKSEVKSLKAKEIITSIKDDTVRASYLGSEKPIITFKEDSKQLDEFGNAILSGERANPEIEGVNWKYVIAEDDIHNLIDLTAEKMKTNKQTVRSEAEMRALADELGFTENALQTLKKTEKDTKNLDSRLTAIRDLLVESAKELQIKAEAAMANNSAEAALAFRKQLVIHSGIQRSLSATRTEVGRALKSFQYMSEGLVNSKDLDGVIAQLGGLNKNNQAAETVLKLIKEGDKRGLNQYARAIDGNPKLNAVLEYYINSLLSSPSTSLVNLTTNSATTLLMPVERMLAGGINMLKGGEGRQIKQAQAMFAGMADTLMDAWRMAGKSWRADEALLDPLTKIEGVHYKAISSAALSVAPESMIGKAIDFLGTIVRAPGRALTTGDEFFKVLNYRMALNEQMYLKAMTEGELKGLTGDALANYSKNYLLELKANPPAEIIDSIKNNLIDTPMHEAALSTARYNTFTQNLSPGMQGIQRAINTYPIAKLFVPFFKVPVNILKFAHERTPVLNMLSGEFRANLLSKDPAVRELAQAKLATGAMAYSTAALLYANGAITGRNVPIGEAKDSSSNDIAGKPAYSIKIGDTWYSYNRLDPLGMMLGLAADASEIVSKRGMIDGETIAVAAIASIAKNITSKTYLQGIANLVEVLDSGTTNKAQKLLGTLIGSAVPSAAFAVAKIADPATRETHELLDYMWKRTPGLSEDLPPVRNIFGEAVTLKPGYGRDSMSPIYTSKETDDPVKLEFMRLGLSSMQTLQQMKKIHGIELTPEQHDRYVQLMGKPLKESLDRIVKSPMYENLSETRAVDLPGGKAYKIATEVSKWKSRATTQMLKEYPELKAEIKKNSRLTRESRKSHSAWLDSILGEEGN